VIETELCITLKRALELPIPSTSTSTSTSNPTQTRSPAIVKSTLIIPARELVQVVAEDIDLNQLGSVGAGTTTKANGLGGFKTDAETLASKLDSNGQPIIREKELKTWVPSPTDLQATTGPPSTTNQQSTGALSENELMNGLEDSLFPKGTELNPSSNSRRTFDKPWDQFEANEKLFGTRTDFDEEIYTTKLDRSGKDFKERERKAEALAREIMASSSANPHVQEERGGPMVDDSGMDEEDK
jgi:PAB1-binding protein PBP1